MSEINGYIYSDPYELEINSDKNNLELSGSYLVLSSSDGSYDITGFLPPVSGNKLGAFMLANVSGNTQTLKHNSSSSDADNRIKTPTGLDLLIPNNTAVRFAKMFDHFYVIGVINL